MATILSVIKRFFGRVSASFRSPTMMILQACIAALLVAIVAPQFLKNLDETSLEISKCPACFGVNFCPQLLTGQVKLEPWSRLTSALHLNARNIYLADYAGRKVVIKKLGHNFEHHNLDQYILKNAGSHWESQAVDHVSVAIRPLTHRYVTTEFIHDELGESGKLVHHLKKFELMANETQNGSDMLMCPSQRKFDYIEQKVFHHNQGVYQLTFLYNLMTMLLFNSEPLVFQSFPAEEGWPFASHLGSCGRFVVEEYVGPNLAEWLPSASWKERVDAALQLLQIAGKLSDGVDGFRMYLTDVSLENIAVNESTGHLKIIDGENIVVVDMEKIKKEKPTNYNIPYQSDNGGCEEFVSDPSCVSYSQNDMCCRLLNDHNWFAVCRQLYAPSDDFGLLNRMPRDVLDRFPNLSQLQQTCYHPAEYENRMVAVRKLIKIYSAILS